MLKILVLVDHAIGISGPHRNVVSSLNALAARNDIQVRLLCDRIDEDEPYAKSGKVDIHLGFNPHSLSKFVTNLLALRTAVRDCDLVTFGANFRSDFHLIYPNLPKVST